MSAGASRVDADALAARARALWREARERERRCLDLYLKASARVRVVRRGSGAPALVSHASESGTAVRLAEGRAPLASFAACTGVSSGSLRWALDAAAALPPGCDPSMPARAEVTSSERRDLDPDAPLPEAGVLAAWLDVRPAASWVECGVTVEALAGDEGWLALRRRRRVWALFEGRGGERRLAAARGFGALEGEALERVGTEWDASPAPEPGLLALSPAAAAPLIVSTAMGVHADPSLLGAAVAEAWSLTDDPTAAEALFGGNFDDAGFPAVPRRLSGGGRLLSVLGGPGTFRRMSYRDAPLAGHSHLVLDGAASPTLGGGARPVARCRVIPVGRRAWILRMTEMGEAGDPVVAGVDPASIPGRCRGTWGTPVLSAEGVLTPGLILDVSPA